MTRPDTSSYWRASGRISSTPLSSRTRQMDIFASNWNEADASNTTAAPDGAPEGMASSGVNDTMRAMMGATKRYVNQQSPKSTGGSSTAYTLSYSVTPGALIDGMTHLVQFNAANGNAPTLNVNSLGVIPLHYYSAGAWRAVPAALWAADAVFRVAYHSASGTYRILGREDTTGDLVPTGRSTARAGTILAYGQAISRTEYPGLFAAYGTTYGVGDGSTTFNVIDMRGQGAVGKSDMGGVDAGNLTGGGVLGAALGGQTNTANTSVSGGTAGSLSVSVSGVTDGSNLDTPSRAGGSQPTPLGNHAHAFTAGGGTSGSLSVSASGTSGAFSVVQPSRVLNYLIRI
ncbi:MAG: hypothetical protein GEV13_36435 [Rhodospirillales bacterium]|nr:hypothetical protein [Rhodospirillales bacterium]